MLETVNHLLECMGKALDEKMPKLGTGTRFKNLVSKLKKKGDVEDPEAVAAAIGRKKWSKKRFRKLATAGKK